MIRVLLSLFVLPAFVIHELLHVIGAAPWARRVAISYDIQTGYPRARIQWDGNDAPRWIAAIAPVVVGSAVGAVGLLIWLMTGSPLPRGPGQVAAWTVLLVWWLIITAPSSEDLSYVRPAEEVPEPATVD